MKVLLLGEYSGVHSSLSRALRKKGYNVDLIHNGDGYKSFEADFLIEYSYITSSNRYFNFLLKLYYVILMYLGVKGMLQIFKYIKQIRNMKGYDVVQLINPIFLNDFGSIVNFIVFLYLKKNNNKIFLCALGDDYFWVRYCLEGNFKYSIFDRLNYRTVGRYIYPLHYVYGFLNPFLNKYVVRRVNAVIPGLYDYLKPYESLENCSEIVPIIVQANSKKISTLKFPLKIFHGWQPNREYRKGNDIFDQAVKICLEKYPNKIEYKIVGGIPYSEYIKTYDECHIFIDQCYSQDSGVNGLLGMASGKVVLGGFELDVKNYYKINYSPLINCEPNIEEICLKIESLILNPDLINEYSQSAINFIKEFHSDEYVVSKYEYIWENY